VNLVLLVLDLLNLKARFWQQHLGKLVTAHDNQDLLIRGFQDHSFSPIKKKKAFVVVVLWSVWVTAKQLSKRMGAIPAEFVPRSGTVHS
jgi:hypothetical protein